MNEKEKIIQRIKNLMNHAESAKQIGSLKEAEVFAAKATELLIQYNLTQFDIDSAKAQDGNEFKEWGYSEEVSYAENSSGNRWKRNLMDIITRHNFCSYTYKPNRKVMQVYGKMQNVDVTVWMYNFLSIGLLRLAKETRANSPLKDNYCRHTYLKDFLLGAVKGIRLQLEIQRSKFQYANNKMNQLAVYNSKALDRFLEQTDPDVKLVKDKPIFVGAGYTEGYKAGLEYNITKPLANAPEKKTNLLD